MWSMREDGALRRHIIKKSVSAQNDIVNKLRLISKSSVEQQHGRREEGIKSRKRAEMGHSSSNFQLCLIAVKS
jgi:hypothetical protein